VPCRILERLSPLSSENETRDVAEQLQACNLRFVAKIADSDKQKTRIKVIVSHALEFLIFFVPFMFPFSTKEGALLRQYIILSAIENSGENSRSRVYLVRTLKDFKIRMWPKPDDCGAHQLLPAPFSLNGMFAQKP